MSKKTCYALGYVAVAVALVSASTIASAANCSTNFCFVDGTMKMVTLNEVGSLMDILGIIPIATSGSTTNIQTGPTGYEGYILNMINNPITSVVFSQPNKITAALSKGSGITFQRGNKSVSFNNLSARLQSAPIIISINSDIQNSNNSLTNSATFWNLDGSGINVLEYEDPLSGAGMQSTIIGNGSISASPEPDGYYHARISVGAVALIGDKSSAPPYATGAYKEWLIGLGVTSRAWLETQDSTPFSSVTLDIRFTRTK